MSAQRRHPTALTMLVTTALAASLTGGLAACSREDPAPPEQPPTTSPVTSSPAATTAAPGRAPILVNAVEPARSLLPAGVADEYGRRIGSLVYRGLLRYDAKGRLVNEVAEDVTQDSPTTYRVKVRKGWVFGNGEPVTARSFVDAWNFAASPACGQLNASAFASIAGYRTLRGQPEPTPSTSSAAPSGGTRRSTPAETTTVTTTATATADPTTPEASPTGAEPTTATQAPAATGAASCPAAARQKLTGLTVVDDLQFTVRLAVPDATFRDQLASLPFAPLPAVALADPVTYAAAPVGNGPYQLAGGWYEGKEVRLIPNASYSGGDPARNGGVTFRFFPDPALTYPALRQGQLEVLDDTPVTALDRYKADLGFRALNQPIGAAVSLVFPMQQPEWASAQGRQLRRAISRVIDRKALADGLFAGTRSPATDLSAPGVTGYAADLCGDDCRHDTAAAAAALPTKMPVTDLQIAYSPEEGGLPAVEAICGAVTTGLKLSCTPYAVPRDATTGATIGDLAARHQLTLPMLSVHRMARPDLGGFLSPRFLAGSADNPSGYAGAKAQTLLAQAAASTDDNARMSVYQDAEKAILADLPEIPLWYLNATTGSAATMQQVKIDTVGVPIYTELNRS